MHEEKLARFEKIHDLLESYDNSKRGWHPNCNANFYSEEIETVHFLDKNKIIFIVLSDRPQIEMPISLLNHRDHNTVRDYLKRKIDYHYNGLKRNTNQRKYHARRS
jgi:hypothetical protein